MTIQHLPVVETHPLTFFKPPLPDELLYSVVVRHHYLSTNANPAQTRLDLFGAAQAHVISDFPCHLEYFCARTHLDLATVIRDHTILDYFRPLIDPARIRRVEMMMSSNSASGVTHALGIQAGQLHFPQFHRYCPRCAFDDVVQYGVRYLHVQHNLPGAYACTRHRCLLEGYQRTRKTLELVLSGQLLCSNYLLQPLLRIADWCVDIFNAHSSAISAIERIAACRHALLARNLLTADGSVRLATLYIELKNYWGPLFEMPPFTLFLHWIERGVFPRSLLYRPEQQFHPIKHILLLDYLFGSWQAFVKAVQQTPPVTAAVSSLTLRPPRSHAQRDADILASLQEHGGVLSKAAKANKVSVQTVKAIAIRHRIPFARRPKKISAAMERRIWRQLSRGWDTARIATFHDISVSSVEQLLNSNALLAKQREHLRKEKMRKQYRAQWTMVVKKNPQEGRTPLRKQAPAAYTWLYRHDLNWLLQNSPERRPAHRPRRGTQERP